ncbi:IS3 family transposase [Corynebacterium diphtheriae]|nr:IS3 family transposase [Corynebacterium diphtheriae]
MIEAKAQAEAASDAERIRVLENENAKLREQRDIVCKAVKYFADETNW